MGEARAGSDILAELSGMAESIKAYSEAAAAGTPGPSQARRGPGRPRKDPWSIATPRPQPNTVRGLNSGGRARIKANIRLGRAAPATALRLGSSSSPSNSSPSTPGLWDILSAAQSGDPPPNTAEAQLQARERCGSCWLTGTSALGQGELSSHPTTAGFNPNTLNLYQRPIHRPEPLSTGSVPLTKFRTKVELESLFQKAEIFDEIEIVGLPDDVRVEDVFTTKGGTSAHYACVAWAEGVAPAEGDDTKLTGVDVALSAALREACGGCGKLGATVPCKYRDCGRKFHWPCVHAYGGFVEVQNVLFLCPDHASCHEEVLSSEGTGSRCIKCSNAEGINDGLFCTSCGIHIHANCLQPSVKPDLKVRAGWQCPDCKSCQQCRRTEDDMKMLVCDACDKGYHTYCMQPPVSTIPKLGWRCKQCRQCKDCGSRSPGNGHSSRWHRNYSVCDSCYQQRNKGLTCPICDRAYRQQKQKSMAQCSKCRKCVHTECDVDARPGLYDYTCPPCKAGVIPAPIPTRSRVSASPSMSGIDPDDIDPELFNRPWTKSELMDGGLSGTESPFSELGNVPGFGEDIADIDLFEGGNSNLSGSGPLSIAESEPINVPNAPAGPFLSAPERGRRSGSGKGSSSSGWNRKKPGAPVRRNRNSTSAVGKGKSASSLGIGSTMVTRRRGRPPRNAPSVVSEEEGSNSEPTEKDKEEEEYVHTVVVSDATDTFTIQQDLCVICGSLGKPGKEGQLVGCRQCGQAYHAYCANVKLSRGAVLRRGWRCLDCTVCEGCGSGADETQLLLCDECDLSYHTYCLQPPLDKIPHGAWRCGWCARCQRCNTVLPDVRSSADPSAAAGLCSSCTSLTHCHKCRKPYQEAELLIHCSSCKRWTHGICEDLQGEEQLEAAADKGFQCAGCRPLGGGHSSSSLTSGYAALYSNGRPDSAQPIEGVVLTRLGHQTAHNPPPTSLYHRSRHTTPGLNRLDSMDTIGDTINQVTANMNDPDDSIDGDSLDGFVSPSPSNFDQSTTPTLLSPVPGESRRGRGGWGRGRGRGLAHRIGIGGFVVRPVRHRPSYFAQNSADPSDMGMVDPEDNPALAQSMSVDAGKKRRRRSRKCPLEDTYPDQIRNAFFGQSFLMGAKVSLGPDVEGPQLEETPTEIRPRRDEAGGAELSQTAVETLKKQEAAAEAAAEDDFIKDLMSDFVGLEPADMGVDDMKHIIDAMYSEGNDNQGSSRQSPADGAAIIEGLDSDTVDWLRGESSQEHVASVPHRALPATPATPLMILPPGVHPPPPPPANPSPSVAQTSTAFPFGHQAPRAPQPVQHLAPSTPGTPGSSGFHDDGGVLIGNPFLAQQGASAAAPFRMAPEPVEKDIGGAGTTERWEQDEPLGSKATIAAVLYANTMHPSLRIEHPVWADRAKQIAKLWRNLALDQRRKFVQLARDNRAAVRQAKQLNKRPSSRSSATASPSMPFPASGVFPSSATPFPNSAHFPPHMEQQLRGQGFFPQHPQQPGQQKDPFKVPHPPTGLGGQPGEGGWSGEIKQEMKQEPLTPSMAKQTSGFEELLEQERREQERGWAEQQMAQVGQFQAAARAQFPPQHLQLIQDPKYRHLVSELENEHGKYESFNDELQKLRKQKKNLAAKQRQLKKQGGGSLSQDELGLINQLGNSIQSWLKQVEQSKRAVKHRETQLSEYEAAKGISPDQRPQELRSLLAPRNTPSPLTTPPGPQSFQQLPPPQPWHQQQHYQQHWPRGPLMMPQNPGLMSPDGQRLPQVASELGPLINRPPLQGYPPQAFPQPFSRIPQGYRAMGLPGTMDPADLMSHSPPRKRYRRRRKRKGEELIGLVNLNRAIQEGCNIQVAESLACAIDRVSMEIDGRDDERGHALLKHLLDEENDSNTPPTQEDFMFPEMKPRSGSMSGSPKKRTYRTKVAGKSSGVGSFDEYTVYAERVNIELKNLAFQMPVQEPVPKADKSICQPFGITALPPRSDYTITSGEAALNIKLSFMPDYYTQVFGKPPNPHKAENQITRAMSVPPKPDLDRLRSRCESPGELVYGSRSPPPFPAQGRELEIFSGSLSPSYRLLSAPAPLISPTNDPGPDRLRKLYASSIALIAGASLASPRTSNKSTVAVELRVEEEAAKKMENVMHGLRILLGLKSPIEYQILDTPPHTPEKGGPSTSQAPRARESCRMCAGKIQEGVRGVRKKLAALGLTPKEEDGEEAVFCSSHCYFTFSINFHTPVTEEEVADAESVLDPSLLSQLATLHPHLPIAVGLANLQNSESARGREGSPENEIRLEEIIQSVVGQVQPYASGTKEISWHVKELPRLGEGGERRRGERRWKGHRWQPWSPTILGSFRTIQDDLAKFLDEMSKAFRQGVTEEDLRRCELCKGTGDGDTNGPGRLLNMDAGRWIHINCALWSSEVYETVSGSLVSVDVAVKRGTTQPCSRCAKPGATLRCYKLRCETNFHFPCAVESNCTFQNDKTLFCPEHSGTVAVRMSNFAVYRRVYVERDESQLIAQLFQKGESAGLVLRVGTLLFHQVGQLLPHQLRQFHNKDFLFPCGYTVSRTYWAVPLPTPTQPADLSLHRTQFRCTIVDQEGEPEFRVSFPDTPPALATTPPNTVQLAGHSATQVWKEILTRVMTASSSDRLKLFPSFVLGESMFGLQEPSILKMVESLPGVDSILTYNFKYGKSPLMDLPLAVNPSGCARTEPRFRSYFKKQHTILSSGTGSSAGLGATTRDLSLSNLMALSGIKMGGAGDNESKWTLYRKMKDGWRTTVYLARSGIQGLGLYAKRDIEMNGMIIEYIGEVIRNEVANRREVRYEQQHRGVYMFRNEVERVVDATMCGGPARYINHSCDPNCSTDLLDLGNGDVKICIIACRPISAGEELTYDYQFDEEDANSKLPCLCGAPNCRKWMN